MPRVHNNTAKPGCVYVGRGSAYGNPLHISDEVSREQAIEYYRNYLLGNIWLVDKVKRELRGKDLVCYCAPLACHADVLLEVANDNLTVDEELEKFRILKLYTAE